MATANELLTSLVNTEEDRVLVIDNDLRTINIPSSITALGVEYDSDVHRLYFQMPKMYGDTDLTEFNVRINYMNANNDPDIYVVTDKEVLESSITFSWLVGSNALAYKGSVKFIVCLIETDADSNILREFNTTIASLPVLEGLEVDMSTVAGEYVDILDQLQSMAIVEVQEESSKQLTNITERGAEVLASIPEDYQTTTELANESVRTKADAIVQTVEGETISVTDSSDDYLRGLRVFGKTTQVTTIGKNLADPNLLPYGFGSTDESGPVLIENVDDYRILVASVTPGNVYTVSRGAILGSRFRYGFTAEYPAVGTIVHDSDTAYAATYDGSTKFTTISVPEGYNYLLVYLTNVNSTEQVENTWYQVELGAEATEYEPYSGGVASPSPDWPQELIDIKQPVVKVFGKNLLDLSKCDLARCTNNNGVLISNIEEHYYATLFYVYLNEYLFNNLGKAFTFSVDHTNTDAYLSIIITGNRLNGSTFQEKKGEYGSRYVSITVADDFTSITNMELRWNRKSSVFTDTTSTVTNIQFELGSTATEYEPYKSAKSLTIPRTLPGIPVTSGGNYTDENDQQWICDEIDLERGVYVQRICCADLTNSTITAEPYNGINRFVARSTEIKAGSAAGIGLCNAFKVGLGPVSGNVSDNTISCFYAGDAVYWRCDACTTVDEMTALIQELGVIYLYPLLEPVETPLTADEIAAFETLHTNCPNTTILNDAGAWMSVKYNVDTKTYVENPKTLRLVDSSTGVVYELKIIDGNLTVKPV